MRDAPTPLSTDLVRALKQLAGDTEFHKALRQAADIASVRENSDKRPRLLLPVTLDLTTARDSSNPYVVQSPFDGYIVDSTTDTSTEVSLSLGGDNSESVVTLKQNVSASLRSPVKNAYLTWAAQAGKSITIVFSLGIDLKPGSFIMQLAGAVNSIDGTASALRQVAVPANTATQLCAANASRIVATWKNDLGAPAYIGPTNAVTAVAGADRGLEVAPGSVHVWRNQGPLFVISAGAATITVLDETN